MTDRIHNTDSFNRPPRLQNSFQPIEIDIPAPPVKPDETAHNLLMSILPMSSFLIMGIFYGLVFSGGGGAGWLYALPMLGIAAFTFVIAYITFGEQKHEQNQRWLKQLREYHRLLDKKEARLLAARELQAGLLAEKFQSPHELLRRVKKTEVSIWERRREDPDFLLLRLGIGETTSAVTIKPPDPDANSPYIRRAFGLYTEYRNIPDVPVVIDLQKMGSVALVGNRNFTLPLFRALVNQLCTLNSPDDVHLYVFSSEAYYRTWKWLRWLPHTSENHVGGQPSFMAFTDARSKQLLTFIARLLETARQTSSQPNASDYRLSNSVIMLFDNESRGLRDESIFWECLKNGKNRGIYSAFICDKLEDVPSDCGSIIEVDASKFVFSATGPGGFTLKGKPDKVALIESDNLAHRLLPIGIRALGRSSQIPTRVNFLQLYTYYEGDSTYTPVYDYYKEKDENKTYDMVERIEQLNIQERWKRTPNKDGLLPFPVTLGNATYKDALVVNLSENNDGPHGLIAGTTGSGKSELLQTLVSSLALDHHPYFLNFMLIDFKGASTFGIFEKMPHVVGLVSNLDKLSANRALEALNTENLRRQRFLLRYKTEDIVEYHKYLIAHNKILDPDIEPLPHLFVIVDEFAQMAQEVPEFLDRLNEIARVGRSLGIHLVLATQRPAGVVKDEMRANLNFRICLRVQTIDDSRDMLRRSDAAYLPHDLPGRAYFQLGDGGTPRQFQVARAGTEYNLSNIEDKRYDLYVVKYEQDLLVQDGFGTKKDASKILFTLDIAFSDVLDTGRISTTLRKEFQSKGVLLSKNMEVKVEEQGTEWLLTDGIARYRVRNESQDLQELKVSIDTVTIAKALAENISDLYSSMPYKKMDQILLPPLGKNISIESIVFDNEKNDQWKEWWNEDWSVKWKNHSFPSLKEGENEKTPSVFQVPVGRLDSLETRSQPPFYLDFLEHGGHVMAIGGPQSGKTYFLKSLCYSLSTCYNPAQVNVYVLSFAGKDLDILERLPHVGSVIDGNDSEKIRRLIRRLQNELEDRKSKFSTVGVKDLHDYNAKADIDVQLPYICVLVDNFGELKTLEYDDELTEIGKLLNIGRMYGLHFIITGLQSADIPGRLTNLIQHRIAFNLTDRSEYLLLVGRPDSIEFDALPEGRSFINVTNPPIRCQIGKPPENLEWDKLASEMRDAWGERSVPQPIVKLRDNEPLSGLFARFSPPMEGVSCLAGVDGDNLSLYTLDWKKFPHILVGGPSQSGRTSLLHSFILGLSYTYSPSQLNIVLVDGSRSLGKLNDLRHVTDWVTEEDGLIKSIANLQTELDYRRHHPDELHKLPLIFFVMDDYDLTCEAFAINEVILSKLGKHIRQDSDLGFHFLISVLPENVAHADMLIKQIRLARTGISLSTVDMLENLGGRPTLAMRNEELKEGRGYFFERASARLVQFAYPDDQAYVMVKNKWEKYDKANWKRQSLKEDIERVRKQSESSPANKQAGDATLSSALPAGGYINMDDAVKRYIQQQQRLKKSAQ